MKKIIWIVLAIFVISCTQQQKNSSNNITECRSDNDCSTGGCSNQICGLKEKVSGVMTTCEFKPEYECYKMTECSCINGKCGWKENKEFSDCLENN